jgi:hypothetical protein
MVGWKYRKIKMNYSGYIFHPTYLLAISEASISPYTMVLSISRINKTTNLAMLRITTPIKFDVT